ncbi:MAG: FecR family protein [Verrucomicrobiales bacterium]|nr:FecR family protein [Verrucomicrobiales bacterium]
MGRNGEVIERFSGEPSISEVGVSGSGKKNVLPNQRKQISGGQSILTKTGASVDLYSPAGAVIQVQAETELHFPEQNDQIPTSSLELLKGRLFLNIDSKQLQSERKEFRLKTPTAILAVKGTKFFAEVKPGVTISGVYEGKVAGIIAGGQTEDIAPGWVGRFFKDNTETGKMSQEEREDRKIFDVISLRKSSLAERAWDWNTFDWEVHTLLKKDGPTGKQEVSNSNIRRGRNKAGNLAVQFRPVAKSYKYGEFRIDSVVPEFGDGFLGAEFRIRVNRELPLIITTIGADQKELEKKKGRLLDDKGFDYLVQFHDLATIQEHKNRYWRNYELKEDEVRLQKDQWSTHFVPFSRNDYTKGYEVKSWFIFLCFGPEVVANREMIELEVAPPTLVFRDGEVTGR